MRIQKKRDKWNKRIDENLKFSQVLQEKKRLTVGFIITLCILMFGLIQQMRVIIQSSSYEIIEATYSYSVEDGEIREDWTHDGSHIAFAEEVTAYRYIYSFYVNGTEYLMDSQSRKTSDQPSKKKLLIRYEKDDPSTACPHSRNWNVSLYMAALVALLAEIIEFLDSYYDRKRGYEYSQIVLSVVISISILIVVSNVAYFFAFESGYYSIREAISKSPILLVILVGLTGFACMGLYDSVPKLIKTNKQKDVLQ